MTLSSQTFRVFVVAASLVAPAVAFAQSGTSREREAATAPTSTRGILSGLDLARFRNLQIVEEDIPADAPTVVLLDDATKARGRAAAHFVEAFVYANFSPFSNNQTALFFNWKSTSGGSGDPDCLPGAENPGGCFPIVQTVPGIFHADGAIFGGGFKPGVTAVSSYEIFAFRSSADPDTQDLAFVEMELWATTWLSGWTSAQTAPIIHQVSLETTNPIQE